METMMNNVVIAGLEKKNLELGVIIAGLEKKNLELEKKVAYLEGLLTGMKVWYDPKNCKFPPGNE